ncbi:MAG: hypothetical protein AcusKO_43220 [Acuticoccus sp.]
MPGTSGMAGREPVAITTPPRAQVLSALQHKATVAELRAALAVVDVGVVREEIGILRVPQRLHQSVLRSHQRGPVVHVRLSMQAREASGGTGGAQRVGSADHGLGRHATDVDARAPDRAVADERYARAALGGGDGGGESGRARTDHGEVVGGGGQGSHDDPAVRCWRRHRA